MNCIECICKEKMAGGNICHSNDVCECQVFGTFDDPTFCGEEELEELKQKDKPKFDRNNFIILNNSRLFTAKEVADFIREYEGDAQNERKRLLDGLLDWGQRMYEVSGIIDSMEFRQHLETLRGKS